MTEKEPIMGWEPIPPHIRLLAMSALAWKLTIKMAEEGRSLEEIEIMKKKAQEIEDLARSEKECTCVLPEQSCDICRAVAGSIYGEDDNGT